MSYSVNSSNRNERLIYLAEAGKSYVLAARSTQLQTPGTAIMSFQSHSLGMDKYEFNDTFGSATSMVMNMYTPMVTIDHRSDVDYYRYRINLGQNRVGVYLQANPSVLVEVLTNNGWIDSAGAGWNNPNPNPNAGRLVVNAPPETDVYFRVRVNPAMGFSLFNDKYYRLWFSAQEPYRPGP